MFERGRLVQLRSHSARGERPYGCSPLTSPSVVSPHQALLVLTCAGPVGRTGTVSLQAAFLVRGPRFGTYF
jgi:hypothetical protein